MGTTVVIVVAVLMVVMVAVLVVGRPRRRPVRSISGVAEREAAMTAQHEVEESDIDQMIEARNALRRRIGKPPIGDELAEDARRERESG